MLGFIVVAVFPFRWFCAQRDRPNERWKTATVLMDTCRRNGSKVHIAMDNLGHLLALRVTQSNEQDADSSTTEYLHTMPTEVLLVS